MLRAVGHVQTARVHYLLLHNRWAATLALVLAAVMLFSGGGRGGQQRVEAEDGVAGAQAHDDADKQLHLNNDHEVIFAPTSVRDLTHLVGHRDEHAEIAKAQLQSVHSGHDHDLLRRAAVLHGGAHGAAQVAQKLSEDSKKNASDTRGSKFICF